MAVAKPADLPPPDEARVGAASVDCQAALAGAPMAGQADTVEATGARRPAPDPYQAFRNARHFPSLDGIRAACILAVIFHHTAEPISWLPATSRGFLGVDMFFLLSGFLIVTLLLRERDAGGRVRLGQFYMRRTLRIFPAYYGLLLLFTVYYLVAPTRLPPAGAFFAALPFYLTYTSNWTTMYSWGFAVSWSLAAEEQFYLLWPAVEKYLKGTGVLVVLAVLLVVNQVINLGALDGVLRSGWGVARGDLVMLHITFTPILLGVALAHALHHRRSFELVCGVLKWRYWPLLLLGGFLVLCNALPVLPNELGWPRLALQLSLLLLLASCVVAENHVLRGLLTWRPLARIGVISYGMYLYHMWVLHFTHILLARLPLRVPGSRLILCLLGTLAVAELSYRLYEAPFLSLKKRFTGARA
jgi:peptidoglycan/LPS O-acetylase OafA/YrhL